MEAIHYGRLKEIICVHIFLEFQYVMLMELAKTKELQNSILDRVLEIEQSERNINEVTKMEP